MSKSDQPFLYETPNATHAERDWLGLQVDHRQFLDALQDEWLCPLSGQRGRIMGINSFAEDPLAQDSASSNLIAVGLQFDLRLLPKLKVHGLSGGIWRETEIQSLASDAMCVFWPGALPLFAATRIVIRSDEERSRVLGLVRQVSNVSLPDAEIVVDTPAVRRWSSTHTPKCDDGGISLAEEYGMVRGATTMSAWAMPRVDPWFDIFVASLSADRPSVASLARAIGVPWYVEVPWMPHARDLEEEDTTLDCNLWRAALRALRDARRAGGIDGGAVVERIREYAVDSPAEMATVADEWREETLSVLRGVKPIRLEDWKQLPVGKILQVLLLRPQPEQFSKWLQDQPGIPPPIWFSAAALCGYLNGYRRLPTSFRGTPAERRAFAVHALKVTNRSAPSLVWPFPDATQLEWLKDKDDIVFKSGEIELGRKAVHPRTLWFGADLDDDFISKAAIEVARRHNWPCFARRATLSNTSMRITVRPNSSVSIDSGAVVVQGNVDFDLPEGVHITEMFDPAAFRRCLVVEGAPRLQPPPFRERLREFGPAQASTIGRDRHVHPVVHGLVWMENYLSAIEEADLVAQIDAGEWRQDLKRRVQHYGWRYDYKTRQVTAEMRLGPLPPWAAELAQRLFREGLLAHVPDQVIVNEYKAKQGISKHVDCKPCFEDGIATISLLESWEMLFSRGADRNPQRVMLPRRSVTILTGDARYEWAHEIPKRATEPGGVRRMRRISITFRKVIVNTASERPTRRHRGISRT